MKYEPIIGLEVHLQSKTKSKMFCRCDANYFGAEPNTHTCPVCLGLPGALPVPNGPALDQCIKLSLALNCKINKETKFDRKNYFYPDLPKAYQISQFDQPVGYEGFLEIEIEGDSRRIRITRVHQEEDTGKSTHEGDVTLLDFNKSGCPLIEVVSEPDLTSVEEVLKYAKRLRQIVRFTGVSDANMEKGEMRFEVNMSLRKPGVKSLPDYKVEVKNIGSISVLEKVIESEYERQSKILDKGETPKQETRGLVDMTGETVSQRSKETSADYRYFPEPDIPPIEISEDKIEAIRVTIPELPQEKIARYMKDYQLEPSSAEVTATSLFLSKYFDEVIKIIKASKVSTTEKEVNKWLLGDVMGLKKSGLDIRNVTPKNLVELVNLVDSNKITGKSGKQVLEEMFKSGETPEKIVKDKGLESISDEGAIETAVNKVIEENEKVVSDLDKNPNAIGFLVGQVMKETRGKADPSIVTKLLRDKLL